MKENKWLLIKKVTIQVNYKWYTFYKTLYFDDFFLLKKKEIFT